MYAYVYLCAKYVWALAITRLFWCRRGLHLHWLGRRLGEEVVVEDRRAAHHDGGPLRQCGVHGHLRKRGCITP